MHKIRKMLAASAAAAMTLTSAAGALTMISAAAAEPSISMGVIAGGANIGVNIYIDLNDISQYDITLDGEAVVVTETDTGCKFSIETAAKDMADKHTVSVVNKSDSDDKNEASFTIDGYLREIAEKDDAYKELTDAMLAYGQAAGDLFNTDAKKINAKLSAAQTTAANEKISSYTKSFTTADYNTTLSGKKAPVTYEGMNLSLRSETVLSLFYLPAEGSDMDAALEYLKGFTGWDTVQKQDVDGTEYISQSVSVPAAKMFDKFTLKKGSDFETKPFGALDYMNTVVSGNYSDALKNVCLTLCNYADAVKNFKEPSGETAGKEEGPFTGTATHYNKAEFGNILNGHLDDYCSDNNIYYCALSPDDYAKYAGGMIEITYNGKTIKALAADLMSEGSGHNIDLQEEAFAELAALSTGTISVSWKVVANDKASGINSGNIIYHLEGSNQYYVKIYIHNPLYPIAEFEYSTDGTNFTPVDRFSPTEGACYELRGIDTSKKLWFRMTDIFGRPITEEAFDLGLSGPDNVNKEVSGTVQFPK